MNPTTQKHQYQLKHLKVMWLFKSAEVKEEEIPEDKLPKALSAKGFVADPKAHVCDWDFFADKKAVYKLNRGDILFSFATKVGDSLNKDEKHIVHKIVNLSSFEDEQKENNVPFLDVYDEQECGKFTCIITKVCYILPGVPLGVLTPMAVSQRDYHRRCQPGSPTIWDDCSEKNVFRMTKKVIPYVFSITLQLKASEVTDEADFKTLLDLDRRSTFAPQKALLMERTKRNIQVLDATRIAKSLLLYTEVDGGVLVQHYTVVLNTSIPALATPVLNNFSSFGAAEGLDTAKLTRAAFAHYAKDDFKYLSTPEPQKTAKAPRKNSGY